MGYMDKLIQGIVGLDRRQLEGQLMAPALTRQGSLITQDWILQQILEGRGFTTQIGDAATLVDFVETAYDEDQPQFALRVPSGVTVIPLELHIALQDAPGTDNLIVLSTTTNDIGDGTSTALTASPLRAGGSVPEASLCTPNSLYTGNATAATGLREFLRKVFPFADEADTLPYEVEWSIKRNATVPILIGPATLQAHIVATTDGPQGFLDFSWIELPTPDLVKA